MKKEKQFIIWVAKQVEYYLPILGLDLHEITVEKNNKDYSYLAIKCSYPYLDPVLYYTDKAIENWQKGNLKKDRILHELCHIITDPLYSKSRLRFVSDTEIEDERERLTDIIAAIIRKLEK
jgi:hypothetical protein